MPVYCEICLRSVHSWETHRHSAEHKRNLEQVRGIPAEVKKDPDGERIRDYWRHLESGAER